MFDMSVFRSKVAAHILKERGLKLDTKNKERIFVVIAKHVKENRIYFP